MLNIYFELKKIHSDKEFKKQITLNKIDESDRIYKNQINSEKISNIININDFENDINYSLYRSNTNILNLNSNNICFKCSGNTNTENCHICEKSICITCSNKCLNKNKKEHQKNIYCNDCMKNCYLCGLNKQCSDCSKKCFSKGCKFYFCSFCFEKNKHQQRPENTNCRFYKCESCNTDSCCITSTIYCPNCDKRICRNCLQKDHIKHINFR